MLKIKKGDTVQAVKGKDKGKKGKVLSVLAGEGRIIVEGVNLAKKAMRKTQTNQQGGIVSIERPLNIANVMYFCKACSHASRVGFKMQEDKTKVRFCKNCKETIQ
jgi:large subunit ribosomal protein L24